MPLFPAWAAPGMAFMVRTHGDPSSLAAVVRHAVVVVDKDQPIAQVQTMQQLLSDRVAGPRFRTALLGVFSLLAPILTAVGLYGVLSYSVTQRTHEIGIRMAMGAERRDVFRLVLGQGIMLFVVGVIVGLAGALVLTRLVASLLYAVRPTDPVTFVTVPLVLAAVALLAAYIPARRATKLDPMVGLRYE